MDESFQCLQSISFEISVNRLDSSRQEVEYFAKNPPKKFFHDGNI